MQIAVSDFIVNDGLCFKRSYLFVIPRPAASLFGKEEQDLSLELVEAVSVHEAALVAVGAVADHLHRLAPIRDLRAQASHLLWK